ncbi:MAG: trypsin-like peptidase domain-containing protein [Phycisphaerae bacterium]
MKAVARSLLFLGCGAALVASVAAEPPDRQRRRSPVVEVFERCQNAVVNISTTRIQRVRMLRYGSLWDDIFDFGRPRFRAQRVQSVGSGVVIHEKGYIVTNAHVVARTSDVRVVFADKRTVEAKIVSTDLEHDLAVLKIDSRTPLPYVELGRSDDIMVGEMVVAIGNPLGLQHTVTSGIVSARDRDLHFSEDVVYRGLIQTDAAINPGNSGGPLLNVNAQLIGINTAIRGDAQNVGFAIPVDRLWALLPGMLDIERRQRVRFGLEVSGPKAEVNAVRPGSPAAQAGLRRGDRITYFNGDRLRDGIDYYVHLLQQEPGETVRLKFERGAKTLAAKVALQPIPPPDGMRLASTLLGMELAPIPKSLRQRHRLPENVGFIVKQVARNRPDRRTDIVPGDVILRVNRLVVRSSEDLGLVLEGVQPGERVLLEGLDSQTSEPWYAIVHTRTRP